MSNTELIKLTETKIGDNTALSTFVEKAKSVTICLFPETVQFNDPALKFGAAIVSVDTKLDQYGNNKDVYKNESGGYCLHLSKINEISQHAGIQITDSRILERKTDEHGRVTFIEHQVRGRVKYVDGSIKEDVATGKYDYFRDREKYVDYKTGAPKEKMIAGRRSHAEALAESNAKTRLYNKLNFKLPSSFTLEELQKPFLVPFVLEDKNELLKDLPIEDQLQIKREVARKRMGLVDNQMYPQNSAQVQNKLPEVNNENISDANFTDLPQEQTGPSKAEQNKIIADEFKTVPQKERTEKIMNLIKIKNWKHPKGAIVTASMIEKATVDDQIKRIEEMLNMPDAVVEEEVSL